MSLRARFSNTFVAILVDIHTEQAEAQPDRTDRADRLRCRSEQEHPYKDTDRSHGLGSSLIRKLCKHICVHRSSISSLYFISLLNPTTRPR